MSRVIQTNEFKSECFMQMLQDKELVYRVTDFWSAQTCRNWAEELIKKDVFDFYGSGPKARRWGPTFIEAKYNSHFESEYFESSQHWWQKLKTLAPDIEAPVLKVQQLISETMNSKVSFDLGEGYNTFAGTLRYFPESIEGEPHVDDLLWNKTVSDRLGPVTQLAWNLYLETPKFGGELFLWNKFPDPDEYEVMRKSDCFSVDPQFLRTPDIVIQPQVGEAIFFHTSRVHGISKVQSGGRLTQSCFIGVPQNKNNLVLWS